jgi:putative membrane protein
METLQSRNLHRESVMSFRPLATFVAAIAFIGAAHAQSPTVTSNVSSGDRDFVTKAAQAGAAEIDQAKLALQKSDRKDLKDFAQRMVTDHTKAADQLKGTASDLGLELPAGESAKDQKATIALQGLDGDKFNQRYISNQRSAHKDAVALFTQESKSGKNAKLKDFAAKTLPTLEDHNRMIAAMPMKGK